MMIWWRLDGWAGPETPQLPRLDGVQVPSWGVEESRLCPEGWRSTQTSHSRVSGRRADDFISPLRSDVFLKCSFNSAPYWKYKIELTAQLPQKMQSFKEYNHLHLQLWNNYLKLSWFSPSSVLSNLFLFSFSFFKILQWAYHSLRTVT